MDLCVKAFINRHSCQFSSKTANDNQATAVQIDKPDKAKPDNKLPQKYSFGSNVTIMSFAAVAGILMLSKGIHKNTNKFLNSFKDYLEGKMEQSSAKSSRNKTKFYEYAIRRINYVIKKSESINNITSVKDALFMNIMYKTEPSKKLHKAISKYFEKLSYKTVLKKYDKTAKSFEIMTKKFDELDESILKNSNEEVIEFKGEKYTKKELIQKAKDLRNDAMTFVNLFIDKKTIKNRYDYINNVTESLYSNFWDASFKDFWSKNNKFKRKEMWQTFIAAEQTRWDKIKVAEWASTARNAISYTNSDQTNIIYGYISKLDGIVPPSDKEGIEIINKLSWYAKHSENYENNKEFLLKELEKLKNHKIHFDANDEFSITQEKNKNDYINLITRNIEDGEPGTIQGMLDIYNKIAPFELAKSGASLSLKKAVSDFDKAVNLETVEFFDKMRDLKLGSAPTDILTIILSFITLSFGFGYAKDKDEKKSVMLKSGIPVVGAIATALYSTTKLVSGGKSLALGFLSGIVLNQLGTITDNLRKQYQSKNLS